MYYGATPIWTAPYEASSVSVEVIPCPRVKVSVDVPPAVKLMVLAALVLSIASASRRVSNGLPKDPNSVNVVLKFTHTSDKEEGVRLRPTKSSSSVNPDELAPTF